MKKLLIILMVLLVAGGTGWFFLLRPEAISQEVLTEDFNSHRKAYDIIAKYLTTRHMTVEITDILIAGRDNFGIRNDGSPEYGDFCDAIYDIMQEDHDAIKSDGMTVEFVYHSTGGKMNKLYGSIIYNGFKKVDGKITVPLTTDGWHLYIAQG